MKKPRLTNAARIGLLYLILSAFWILITDYIASLMAIDVQALTTLQNIKGWFFVSASAFLIFLERKHATTTLSERQNRHQLLFDNSPSALLVYQDELIVFANDAAAKLLKVQSPDALEGLAVAAILPEGILEDATGTDRASPVREYRQGIRRYPFHLFGRQRSVGIRDCVNLQVQRPESLPGDRNGYQRVQAEQEIPPPPGGAAG